MPAIRPNCRSSGVATAEAIVSGLAPGKPALTMIVGKLTCGNGETGSRPKAMAPESVTAIVSSVVATGLLMNGADMFIAVQNLLAMPPSRRSQDQAINELTG